MRDEFVRVDVAVVSWSCWRCRRDAAAAVAMLVPGAGWVAVGEALCAALGDEALAGWRDAAGLGAVKPRWSRSAGRSYWSQGCRWCDALFGEFLLREAFVELHARRELVPCSAGLVVLSADAVLDALGFA